MKLKTTYRYPEGGTANGRVYPRKVLREAFNDPAFIECCESSSIPVLTEGGRTIGWATAHIDETMQVTVDAEIYDKILANILAKCYESTGVSACILGGRGELEYDPEIDRDIVTKFIPENVLLCSKPAVKHNTQIMEE